MHEEIADRGRPSARTSPRYDGHQSQEGRDLVTITGLLYVFSTPLDFVPSPLLTPSSAAGLLFLATWVISLLAGRASLPPRSFAVPIMAAISAWYILSISWSWDPGLTANQSRTFTLLAVSAIALGGTFRDRFLGPVWALALGASVAAAATLTSGRQVTVYAGIEFASERSTFLGIDQNVLAFHLGLGLAAASYLLVSELNAKRRLVAIVMVGLLSAGILSTGSRTGAGSLVMTMGVFAIASTRSVRSAMAWLLTLALAVWGAVILGNAGLLPSRLVEWLNEPTNIDGIRSQIIDAYWYSRQDWMIRGVGAGADASYLYQTQAWFKSAHSAFWKVWIETGLVGLMLWISLLLLLYRRALMSSQRWFFVLATPTIAAFFYTLGGLNSNMLWVLFGLALGSSATESDAGLRSGSGGQRGRPSPDMRTSSSAKAGYTRDES